VYQGAPESIRPGHTGAALRTFLAERKAA